MSAGIAQFFNHLICAVGVARVDDKSRRPLQIFVFAEPLGDGVTGAGEIVVVVRFVMVRKQIVVEKDCVVGVLPEKFFGFVNCFGDVEFVAGKSFFKPAMSSSVIVKQKNCNRTAVGLHIYQAEAN